jgi:diadenosine tetraphosphate (Ap4A) HIT family hydrolase
MKKECLFCQKSFQEQNIFENNSFYINIDQNPVNPGHLLIIPKRHIKTFFELNKQEFENLQEMILKAKELSHSKKVKEVYQEIVSTTKKPIAKEWCQLALNNWEKEITGFNIGVNNGETAGQTIFHLHIHLIPRFEGDVENPVGGVRFVIPQRANYRR